MKQLPLHTFFLSAILLAPCAHAQISVYISSPGSQNVAASDFGAGSGYLFATETFALSEGTYSPIGTSDNTGVYGVQSGAVEIESNELYGGGTGQGNYLSIASGGSVSLTFATPVNYFGFEWTAGNSGNQVRLYGANNEILGAFDTSTIVGLLNGGVGSITGINGATYNTADYYGLPGDRAKNAAEAYSYLHFINQGSTAIARIELSHNGGGAFESDNHSTRADSVSLPLNSPLVLIIGELPDVVPEPSTALIFGLAGCLSIFSRRRSRQN